MLSEGKTEIQLQIGAPVHVERRLEKQSLKGASRIIGASEEKVLMIAPPMAMGKPILSLPGEHCIVRLLQRGQLFGFRTKVLKVFSDPLPILMLEYPRSIEEMSLRKSERLDCDLPSQLTAVAAVLLTVDGEPPELDAPEGEPEPQPSVESRIIDLAAGGCQVVIPTFSPEERSEKAFEQRRQIPAEHRANYHPDALKTRFAEGSHASLGFDFPAPWTLKFPDVPCQVRWIKHLQDSFLLGLSFADPDAQLSGGIEDLIEHQQRYFPHGAALP